MSKSVKTFDEIVLDKKLKKQLKELVVARIRVMPSNLRLAIGTKQLSKEDLEKHVEKEDEIGAQIMEMELEFLQDLASGAVYAE